MSDSFYTIRNYQPADFDKYLRLSIEVEKLEPTGRCISPQIITEHLGRPNYFPEQDLLVIEIAGNLVGYLDMARELAIGRVILDCWVHPKYRRRGLATKLLGYAIQQAKELEASVTHANISQDNVVAQNVLSKLGFECMRRFLELKLNMTKIRWQDIEPGTVKYRHLRSGEEGKLTRIQNRFFAGIWGYNPNTVDEISYRLNLSNSSPEDVVLTCDGDKIVGYCWTKITCTGKGRIFMLGVDPEYRGRGVGKIALQAGLAYLKSKDLRVADLTVDSENKAACALYRSAGFEIRTSSFWYEKAVK